MTARILDRGYRRYEGERRGVKGAIFTVTINSIQRALGLRRTAWAKVLPFLFVVAAYVPAIVFIGIVSLLPEGDAVNVNLPTYAGYLSYITLLVALLVALVAPEILCTDRRTGMLGMYLASPLKRDTYLVAKAIATFAVLGLITIGPTLLMLIAFMIQGHGPDGPLDVVITIVRIILSGVVITVLYTAFSMGVSSLTDRKAFAAVGIVLFFFLSNVVTGILHDVLQLGDNVIVLNIFFFPVALVEKIHGESTNFSQVSFAALIFATVVWTGAWGWVCRFRYQHLQVTK